MRALFHDDVDSRFAARCQFRQISGRWEHRACWPPMHGGWMYPRRRCSC